MKRPLDPIGQFFCPFSSAVNQLVKSFMGWTIASQSGQTIGNGRGVHKGKELWQSSPPSVDLCRFTYSRKKKYQPARLTYMIVTAPRRSRNESSYPRRWLWDQAPEGCGFRHKRQVYSPGRDGETAAARGELCPDIPLGPFSDRFWLCGLHFCHRKALIVD